MKKLFFIAALAIVAVGGAFAQQYSTEKDGEGTLFNCTIQDEPTCTDMVGERAFIYPTDEEVELPEELFYDEI